MGILPHFIDGHQHIHQLPIIRDALLAVYESVFSKHSCYIRVPIMKPPTLKSSIITFTGGLTLRKALMHRNIPHNTSFSGVYNFSKAKNYRRYFCRFLKNIQSGGLIMCHPGLPQKENNDRIDNAREYEFNYLNSDLFLEDCKTYSISVHSSSK